MHRIARACLGVCFSCLVSCSSSDSTNGSGSTGGGAGAGGSTQGDCSAMECFRAIKCVRECGGTAVTQGCCGCTAPLFDDLECARDSADAGGASGQNDASVDAASGRSDARACEVMECLRAYECVSQCGGAVVNSGCCACEAPLFDNLQCDAGK